MEKNQVILFGQWASPYVKRVEWALKTKGIAYGYVEEDLMNKSSQLVKYNPVYKKVPVLVHHGKPITESPVILEYIDETWKNGPRLLPEDPYKTAKVRFWANFLVQLFDSMVLVARTGGESQVTAMMDASAKVKIFEEGMKEFFPDGKPCVNNENMGLLDIVMCSMFSAYKAQEEVIGIKILDAKKTPLIFSWVTALNALPLVKETIPPHEKMVPYIHVVREKGLKGFRS